MGSGIPTSYVGKTAGEMVAYFRDRQSRPSSRLIKRAEELALDKLLTDYYSAIDRRVHQKKIEEADKDSEKERVQVVS